MRYLLTTLLIFIVLSGYAVASPCDDMHHDINPLNKEILMREIGEQLKRPVIDIICAFKFKGWSIINVSAYQADDAFLFYAHDPLSSHYVTLWGGAARIDDEKAITSWVIKNAPGIPKKLAACFARYVTKGKDW